MGSIHNLKLLGSELCALMDNFSTLNACILRKILDLQIKPDLQISSSNFQEKALIFVNCV